jgi:hypothetical protein
MLSITKTKVRSNDEYTYTSYDVDGYAQLAGDSIWDYDYAKHGMQVAVTHIGVTQYNEEAGYATVNVTHSAGWEIYTDTGFASAISKALGYDVGFTEQGMQEDGLASMEGTAES